MSQELTTKHRSALLFPALSVIGLIGFAPLLIILTYSFLQPGPYGGVEWSFTTEAYFQFIFERDIFEDDIVTFNWSYLAIYFRSFWIALLTTFLCILCGFPVAYFIATRPKNSRSTWLFLVTLPFWTNLLVRTYAIMMLIRDEGVINLSLMKVGIIENPIIMIYTNFATIFGLFYAFMPFMVLPIYASLEKMDFRLVEAGFDLYGSRLNVFRKIILPLAKPGIISGGILVFIPCLGAYITPALLGGGKNLMIGSLIEQQFRGSRNWPLGSAAALLLMVFVLLALMIYTKRSRRTDEVI